jgi:hypothetical protein
VVTVVILSKRSHITILYFHSWILFSEGKNPPHGFSIGGVGMPSKDSSLVKNKNNMAIG